MVVGRLRKALKRSLAIAMAAALMATSVPELSVTAMAAEAVYEEDNSESTAPEETEEGASQDKETSGSVSAEQKEDTSETQESSAENYETDSAQETESASDTKSTTKQEDNTKSETEIQTETETGLEDTTESDEEEESATEERIDKEADADQEQGNAAQGTIIYENDFELKNVGEKSDDAGKTGTVAKIGSNQAMEYDVALTGNSSWEEAFMTSYELPQAYETPVKEKLTMEFDVYFPNSAEGSDTKLVNDFGTMKLQIALNNGDNWDWLTADSYPEVSADGLEASDIEGYCKKHISVDISGSQEENNTWELADFNSLRAVTIKVVGDTSTYQGKLYIDNVVLKDTSTKSEDPNPEEPDDPGEEEKPLEGELIYKQDFNDLSSLGNVLTENVSGRTPELAELTAGNKAVKYTVSALSGGGWDDIFKAEFKLNPPYEEAITDKVIMSYDIYFPSDGVTGSEDGTFDSMKAQAALKSGSDETWVTHKVCPEIKAETLVEDAKVPGFRKAHIVIDMNDFETWDGSKQVAYPFEQITPIKAVIPCLAGSGSTYAGDIYLDNLEVRAVSSEEENPPTISKELIYENDFNDLSSLGNVLTENVSGRMPELAELAAGNKAVKYTVSALSGGGWDDIFKAEFKLDTPYEEAITDKVIMSYDVYFPSDGVTGGEDGTFDSMKAQAALKSGSDETWVTHKVCPEIKAETLVEDAKVPGFRKAHIEIDMNDFETWDGSKQVAYPFEQITPIKAVIPCLAGSGSTYSGDLYLDNLKVWAVNETSEIPDPTEDVVLELDASAWEVTEHFDYSGESRIENKTINDKKLLAVSLDYSKNTDKGWSEAKFDYSHPTEVASLKGYNAFVADVYYKPADKSAGSLGIKLFAKSPETDSETINSDAALPEGEAVDIPELEGYYKAEYVLEKKYEGAFQNMTLGFIGKNTDFVGDVYFDNMRFTKRTTPDIYVDATIEPKKGDGIRVVDDGRAIQTASGQKTSIAENVALVDAKAVEATKNLYAYLKAVGESDSVIFGHQNDTHHKAGNTGEDFSNSDTKDVTGSIAGVIGIDTLSLTGNEASEWNTPEAEKIANVARITREAAAEGALITLSAHMPNFALIDERVKEYEISGGTTNETFGYWEVDGEKQYNFSGCTPGTLKGNVVARIMPGQDLNYLYTDYLDLIADYAKAVEGDGITILFRPLHENTGSWFWWGAALCDEQAYIALYRYTVDYLKETRGVHNILYVYGPGSEAANAEEYAARYPGDAYVDMIGYDLYHQNPSPDNEEGYLQSISRQNRILKEFAAAHNKLYAITETGVADKNEQGAEIALKRTGNKVMDWYAKLLDQISEDKGICYFLVWANFDENGSFYLPYVTEKKENGVLHGHEMMDEFIKFYNDNRSVFATDMNSGFKNITGVTNTTTTDAVSGYITAPQSGDRLLYSRQMKSAVSIAPAAAAKRHISLCGCVHGIILSGQSFRPSV